MPTTFANTIDGNPIYAARSTADKDGNQIDTTYAKSASLATVATSGEYDDLSNKPLIPAAQVNSDWNAASGVAQILNKPSLATVATSGDYDDLTNKPSIPAAQVNSDWNASSGVAEILNKPTLATVATTGAYSDLTGTPTIPDGVPTVTSSDDGKVLTAAYSGGVGSYAWATAGGGSSNVEIVDETDISTRFPTYNDLVTEIANGKYFIIKSTNAITSMTDYYCLAQVYTTNVCFAYANTSDGKVSYNWTLFIRNSNGIPTVSKYSWSSDKFKHNEWVDTNHSQYVPLGTYTEGYVLAAPMSSTTVYLYKCILGYTESSSSVAPGSDTTHWQRTYLQDVLNSASSFTQVQANWTESDNTSPSYIQNKPTLATVATSGSYNDLSNTPTIPDGVPPVTSSDDGKVLTADYTGGVASYSWETPSGGGTSLFEAVYGTTTYAEVAAAVTDKKIVYCKVPQSGTLARMAFLAYLNPGSSSSNFFEFQYYRSLSSKSYSNQMDEVFIYTLSNAESNQWSTTSRNVSAKIVAGTNMNYTYSSGTLKLNAPASGNMLSVTNNTMNVTTTAGITDIQKVSALPANPVSTVLYLIEE